MIASRILLPLSLALVVSTTAWAGMDTESGDKAKFKQLDKDDNGRITQQEAKAHEPLANHFEAIDANGDGAITRKEFKQGRKAGSSS